MVKPTRLRTVQELRNDGYVVVIFSPEELGQMTVRDMEAFLVQMGNEAIEEMPEEPATPSKPHDHKVVRHLLLSDGMTAEEVLEQLRAIRVNGPTVSFVGICGDTDSHFFLKYLIERWPHYSGDPDWPVTHPTLTPGEAYQNLEDIWGTRESLDPAHPDDQYRLKRWELLDWLIEQVEALPDDIQ